MPIDLDISRRRALAAGLAAALALAAPMAAAEDGAASEGAARVTGDVPLGDPEAPVTVVEYLSLTCPHCAAFHIDTWPEIKAKYVETGQVRFVIREVYFDRYGLWASMLARCGGEGAYHPMIDAYLERQAEWTGAEDIPAALQRIARMNGLSGEKMRACLQDREFAEGLVARYQETTAEDGIRSTPSFVIDGRVHTGNMSVEEFSRLIETALEG